MVKFQDHYSIKSIHFFPKFRLFMCLRPHLVRQQTLKSPRHVHVFAIH